jgi:hypothetical protein
MHDGDVCSKYTEYSVAKEESFSNFHVEYEARISLHSYFPEVFMLSTV